MTSRTKITMAGARAFAAAGGREAVLWDSAAPGLGLRARPNGRKTWIVHRHCNGSVVRRTLGALAALRFLLYTGARKSEALRLKWEHVHGDRAVLPDSKTGPRTLWLASPARAVLDARSRRNDCPWVFAGSDGAPVALDKAWNAVRAAAGLPALRIHDLRHSLAAVSVNGGEGLRTVAGLLGHADIKTTFGYAHLAEGSVFDAANRVSRGLADMLDGGEADHG